MPEQPLTLYALRRIGRKHDDAERGETDGVYYNASLWYGAPLGEAMLDTDPELMRRVAARHAKRTNQPASFLRDEVELVTFVLNEQGTSPVIVE